MCFSLSKSRVFQLRSGTEFGEGKISALVLDSYTELEISAQVPDLDTDLGDSNSGPETGFGALGEIQHGYETIS